MFLRQLFFLCKNKNITYKNIPAITAGIALLVFIVFRERIIKCCKYKDIRKICDRNNHVREKLCGIGKLGFQIYGNHGRDNHANNKDNDIR